MTMKKSKGIVWLSSYPKSGNTWFRIFLAHILGLKENKTIDINEVKNTIHDRITTEKTWVSEFSGVSLDCLNEEEIEALLPNLYRQYHQQQQEPTYHKIHRAYSYIEGEPLIPLEACSRILYFVRNPLDVAVSMANHFNCSIDEAIRIMSDDHYVLRYFPLPQKLWSWSKHVESWLSLKTEDILFLRYEDMLEDSTNTFSKALDFLNISVPAELIHTAITQTSFENLRKFEDTVGFKDKPYYLKNFFRKGISGDWEKNLTNNQIDKIIRDHGETMEKFNYLPK